MAILKSASYSANTAADQTAVAAVTGSQIKVYQLVLSAAAAATATFKDGAGTSLSGVMTLATGTPLVLPNCGSPWFVTSQGNAFIINQSAVQVSGTILYEVTP